MSENIYTIPGLISHATPEVEQSPTPNQLRLAVTFPDRLILSSNEQIGVLMDFAASVPATIAASGKAYCQRIMTDVTRNNATERFSCVFYIDTVPLQLKSLTEEDQSCTVHFDNSGGMRYWLNGFPRHSYWKTDQQATVRRSVPASALFLLHDIFCLPVDELAFL
mgnify:CR=1 FL=1